MTASGAMYLNNTITGLFDIIRSKASISGSMTFSEAMSVINSLDGGGDNSFVFELITRTISDIPSTISNSISIVREGCFYSCSNLTTISFPNCSTIKEHGFAACNNLTAISFPNCKLIKQYGVAFCDNLISISLPNCSIIESYAFNQCGKITSVNLPSCISIQGAFRGCSNLITANLPVCVNISGTFYGCSNLTSVSLPLCRTVGEDAFYGCSNLTTLILPSCDDISSYAFYKCVNLKSLYLLYPGVATLRSIDAFSNTPLARNGSGKIYVPSAYARNYRADTWNEGWDDLASIVGI